MGRKSDSWGKEPWFKYIDGSSSYLQHEGPGLLSAISNLHFVVEWRIDEAGPRRMEAYVVFAMCACSLATSMFLYYLFVASGRAWYYLYVLLMGEMSLNFEILVVQTTQIWVFQKIDDWCCSSLIFFDTEAIYDWINCPTLQITKYITVDWVSQFEEITRWFNDPRKPLSCT
jgi:hypothetical protein